VEAIVGHRQYNGKLMYKIRWKNYGPVDDTWESYESLSCPDLLEAYNLKHDIVVPTSKGSSSKKRKSGGDGGSGRRGRPKGSTAPKKRRSSIEETDDDEEEMYSGSSGDENEEYEVNNIVQMRFKKDGTREFLVHWKRWSSHYDTWEPEANLSCPEIIEKFMKKLEEDKNLNPKELRATRKHTQHFTLNTHDSGRRLSKRNNKKIRVTYYGDEKSDED
jgi:Chromo (CHRromatin Organisation MOdifier) domain